MSASTFIQFVVLMNHLKIFILSVLIEEIFLNMEVSVYMNQACLTDGKSVFKRVVLVPDAFDVRSFVSNMKAIFGESVIVSVLFV